MPRAVRVILEYEREFSARMLPELAEGTARGWCVFASDDLQALVGTDRIMPELALVREAGRRYGLDFAGITQEPNLIHTRIRNQATEVVPFQQMDPRCVEWCEEVGFEGQEIRGL